MLVGNETFLGEEVHIPDDNIRAKEELCEMKFLE